MVIFPMVALTKCTKTPITVFVVAIGIASAVGIGISLSTAENNFLERVEKL
jgi:hypothetical protein